MAATPAHPEPELDLEACVRGEPAAWDALVAGYGGLIRAAVRRVVPGDRATRNVDDAVQDVLLRLVKDDARLLRTFDPSRARFSTWIALVARSTAIDLVRKRELPAADLSGDAIAVTAPEPEDPPEVPEIPDGLLSARQALVVRLLFEEGRGVPEVAAILDVDEQTVRSTKHKALVRLRGHFAPPPGPAPDSPREAGMPEPAPPYRKVDP